MAGLSFVAFEESELLLSEGGRSMGLGFPFTSLSRRSSRSSKKVVCFLSSGG